MADDLFSPTEAAKLTTDIQRALKAYGEFQTQMTEALRPWQEQWAALQNATRPFYERMQELADAQRRWSSAIQDAQKLWQAKVNEWASMWAAAQEALAKEIAEAGPRLRRTLERADHVGKLGWTVSFSMTPVDMSNLSRANSSAEADRYMVAWYEAHDADLTRIEERILGMKELEPFSVPLGQCFASFRRSEFAIVLPCLIAVLERSIRNLCPAEHFFSTKVQRMVKEQYDKAKLDDPDALEVFVWMSLYSFVQWLYEQYGPGNATDNRLFRHGIQHGTQPPPNERVEVLRLFHALDSIGELYPDSSETGAEESSTTVNVE